MFPSHRNRSRSHGEEQRALDSAISGLLCRQFAGSRNQSVLNVFEKTLKILYHQDLGAFTFNYGVSSYLVDEGEESLPGFYACWWALDLRHPLDRALLWGLCQLPALLPPRLLWLQANDSLWLTVICCLRSWKRGQGQSSCTKPVGCSVNCRILEISLRGRSWDCTLGRSSSWIHRFWDLDFCSHRRIWVYAPVRGGEFAEHSFSFGVLIYVIEPNETVFCLELYFGKVRLFAVRLRRFTAQGHFGKALFQFLHSLYYKSNGESSDG
eukprot:s6163_g1.t1